jgi:GNAT superfamily N-acetyltransferase
VTQTSATYRRAGPEDAEAVAAVIAELVQEANRVGFERALSPEEVRAWISRLGEGGAVFLCLVDDAVVGFSALDFNTQEPETATLGVWLLRPYRGQCLGTRLAGWTLDFARARGYRRIRGRLPARNKAALSFLSSIGALVPIYNPEMRFELPL